MSWEHFIPRLSQVTYVVQRSAIAVTIIGGQLLCLALSLVVVPVGYSLVEEARAYLTRRHPAPASAPAAGD